MRREKLAAALRARCFNPDQVFAELKADRAALEALGLTLDRGQPLALPNRHPNRLRPARGREIFRSTTLLHRKRRQGLPRKP